MGCVVLNTFVAMRTATNWCMSPGLARMSLCGFFGGRLGEPLREVEVRAVERLRDGGTTFITTSEGYFYAPARASTSWLCGVSG